MPWWNAKNEANRTPPQTGKPSLLKGKPWPEARRRAQATVVAKGWSTFSEEKKDRLRKLASSRSKGKVIPPERRQRISATLKARHKDPEFKKQHLAVVNRPERLAKLAIKAKERWANPEFKRRVVAAVKAGRKPITEERRQRLSAIWKGRTRPPRTPEHCRNLSRSLRKPETIRHLAEVAAKARTRQAKPNDAELKLQDILNQYFPNRFRLNVKNGVIVGGKIPDFVANDCKMVIELFGNYWHGQRLTGNTKRQEEKARVDHFRKVGYETLIIWEYELASEHSKIAKRVKRKLSQVGGL